MEKLLSSIWWKIFLCAISLAFLGLALFVIYDTMDNFFHNNFNLTCVSVYDFIGRSCVLLVFFYVSGVLGLYPLPEFCYRHPLFTWKWWQNLKLSSPTPPNNVKRADANEPLKVSPTPQESSNGPQEPSSSTTNFKIPVKVDTDTCPIGDGVRLSFGDRSLNEMQAKPSNSNKLPILKNHSRGETSDRDENGLTDIAMGYRTRDMGFYYLEQSYPDFQQSYPYFEQSYPDFEQSYPDFEQLYPNLEQSYPDLNKTSMSKVSTRKTQPSILHRRSKSQNCSVKSVPKRFDLQNLTAQKVPKVPVSYNIVIRDDPMRYSSRSFGGQTANINLGRRPNNAGHT